MANSGITTHVQTKSHHLISPREQRVLKELSDAASSENTTQTYQNAVSQFLKWGGLFPTTPSALLSFIVHLKERDRAASTIESYVRAISGFQSKLGYTNPTNSTVSKHLKGLKRINRGSKRKGDIFTEEELILCLRHLSNAKSLVEIRNELIFKIILWTGCRTEEIANLKFEDISSTSQGLRIHIRFSKSDQEGEGEVVELPELSTAEEDQISILCPVFAFRKYKVATLLTEGALFRRANRNKELQNKGISKRSIRGIIKTILQDAGIDESRVAEINGHSFRHTIATLASRLNINLQTIQKLGRWQSTKSLESYSGNHASEAIKTIANSLRSK